MSICQAFINIYFQRLRDDRSDNSAVPDCQSIIMLLMLKLTGDKQERKMRDVTYKLNRVLGSTILDLLVNLDLDQKYIGLVIANGRQVKLNYLLSEGDKVDLLSPMSGG